MTKKTTLLRGYSHTRLGAIGLLVLASCFRGPTTPTVTLAPANPDAVTGRTRGPFAVVYAAPKGHVVDRKQPGVTVLFSRGVRSVEMADDERVPAITIKTKGGASVPGSWRWTGTRGLLFTPEGELPGGNSFVVSVPENVTALDGSVLGRPYTFELETDGPSVSKVRVVGPPGTLEKSMPSDVAFRVEFDQSVDPAAVAKAASLHVYSADGDKGETLKLTASRDSGAPPTAPATSPTPKKGAPPPVNVTQVPDSYVVLLKPERPLPADHQVDLILDASLHGTGGPHPMSAPYTHPMRTHGPLRFVDFYCPRIEAKGRCRQRGDVKVVMSNPVSPEELKAHVKLGSLPPRPPPKPGAKGVVKRIDPSIEHWLGVSPKLGESYKVTLTSGLKDIYGQKLARDVSFDLDVESPLSAPKVAPEPTPAETTDEPKPKRKPKIAVNPADTRPRRERLPYRLELGLSGNVIEAGSGRHRVPVGSVNIPTYSSVAVGLNEIQATTWAAAKPSTPDFLSRNGFASTWVTTHADTNERAVDFLDLDAVLAPKKGRGAALVVLAAPGTLTDTGSYNRTESMVTVTDLGVTAKMSPFGGLVWVTQLSTGKPVAGATVAIRTVKNGEVFQAQSDAQGLVIVPIEKFDPLAKEAKGAVAADDNEESSGGEEARVRDDSVIVVKSGDDWTVTKVAASAVDARLTGDFQKLAKDGRWTGMLFADRGVFRPGETAKVSGIARVVESGTMRSLAGRELRIQLLDHNSEQLFDGRARCDDFGTFSVDVPIPKTADIGLATIQATAAPGGKSNTSEPGIFRQEVRILAFKPNEFKVSSEADKPFYVRGDTATFSTQGDYLYGAPMQGASVTSTISRQEVPFAPPGSDGFTVADDIFTGDYPDETKAADQLDSQDGVLDAKGHFERKVPLAFDDQRRPERIMFDAEVQDLSRNTVSSRTGVMLHPGEFYVGLHSPKDRFVAAGTAHHPEVAAFDPTGVRKTGIKVKLELVERRWAAVTGEQPDGRPIRSSKAQDTVVTSCDAVTSQTVGTCDLRVPRAGYFVVRATATDSRGNTVRSSHAIYGTEDSPSAPVAWAADDRHSIKLEANKKAYDVGETAKIVLRNPFKEASALVTVERNGVLSRQVVPLKGPVPVVEVPVAAGYYPNAYVSVVALRGRVGGAPATGADLAGPDFRFGWTELRVNEDAHRLKVNITEPKSEYQPGSIVESDVVVRDQQGRPVETALTFYVVDEGVLALTSYATPDPLPAFLKRRRLSVFTFDNREHLAHILPMRAGERVSPLGYEYALARNAGDSYDKGDDGGDGAGGPKRADFRTTAYFEAGRKTDKNGHAHFSFKVPDNLTTFRIMAVAAAADDKFGSGESKVTTFRRLMARPALPRIIRVGDQLEASVIVSSKVDDKTHDRSPMNVNVKLSAKGLTVSGPTTKTISMAHGGQAEVRFPVKAGAAGEAVLDFQVQGGADSDRVEVKRAIELPVSKESAVVYGETKGSAKISLGDLATMRRDYGGLEVRVSSSQLVGLGMTVEHLLDYPYGCTEQISSRVLPLVAMMDLAKDTNVKLPKDVNAFIDTSMETLVKRQNPDGGFGFWDKTSSEPWLSAYALLAISGAHDKKRFVPRDVIEQGRSYLSFRLSNLTATLARKVAEGEKDEGTDNGPEAVEKRRKAAIARTADYVNATLMADTLVSLGWSNPGALNILYDARGGQRLSAQAALLHAMAKAEMSDKQIKTFLAEVESRLRVGAKDVDVDEADADVYGSVLESHTRTLAMVLRALLAVNPKHTLAPRIAKRLLSLRQPNGGWRTTQEDGWTLMALADYRRLQESGVAAFEATTNLGGSEILSSKFPRNNLREDKVFVSAETLIAKGPSLEFDINGDGPLYYSAELKYATTMLPQKPRDEGLFVAKYVRSVPAANVTEALKTIPRRTADAVSAGELVLVDLVFESAEPRERIVLDDPLPAGLEALDYDLDTTSKANRDAEAAPKDHNTSWLGTTFRDAKPRREVRDDRVVNYFDSIEPGMYRVHYLARATSIGSFIVPPTRIEAMYEPEVYGRTAASTLVVRGK